MLFSTAAFSNDETEVDGLDLVINGFILTRKERYSGSNDLVSTSIYEYDHENKTINERATRPASPNESRIITTFKYNEHGLLTEEIIPRYGGAKHGEYYYYDKRNLLAYMERYWVDSNKFIARSKYDYFANGQLKERNATKSDEENWYNYQYSPKYNNDGEVITIVQKASVQSSPQFTPARDAEWTFTYANNKLEKLKVFEYHNILTPITTTFYFDNHENIVKREIVDSEGRSTFHYIYQKSTSPIFNYGLFFIQYKINQYW